MLWLIVIALAALWLWPYVVRIVKAVQVFIERIGRMWGFIWRHRITIFSLLIIAIAYRVYANH